MINNDFILNCFQILAQTKQNNGLPHPTFGTVTVSFKVSINVFDYLNFNR